MAFNATNDDAWMHGILQPSVMLPYVVAAALVLVTFFASGKSSDIPLLNPRRTFELTNFRAKMEFVSSAAEMLERWFTANPDKPARFISDFGLVTVLPSHLINEIRNDERLSFSKWTYSAFHAHLPGFEGFREGSQDSHIVKAVLLKDLTKTLNKITEPLASETAQAIPGLFGESSEWKAIPLRETLLPLIARVSSRIFLGEELCRNEAWLKLTTEYSVSGIMAAQELRMWPSPLRSLVHWFLPYCTNARAKVREARALLEPVLEQRRQQKLEGQGGFDDAIEWMEKEAKGRPYDAVSAQLLMSVAAMHTTTDLTLQTLARLAKHPEILEQVRKEIREVLGENGWKKTSLYSMKLLDAVIKETQRLTPIGTVAMRRVALEDIKLSDGTFVSKDSTIAVSSQQMWDAKVYDRPNEWDGYRFYRMRQTPGNENLAQLVSTSPDHLGFGHGQHACPGRFFAANEVKIVLIYLLTMYDWRLPEGVDLKVIQFGFILHTDPTMKMEIRRREKGMLPI